jgi:hypothetical protein
VVEEQHFDVVALEECVVVDQLRQGDMTRRHDDAHDVGQPGELDQFAGHCSVLLIDFETQILFAASPPHRVSELDSRISHIPPQLDHDFRFPFGDHRRDQFPLVRPDVHQVLARPRVLVDGG